jgi:hypothetical protein
MEKVDLTPLVEHFIWNDESKKNFENVLKTPMIQHQMENVLKTHYNTNEKSTEQLCVNVGDLIQKAAELSLKKSRKKKNIRKQRYTMNKGMLDLYRQIKSEISNLGQLIQKYPRDPYIRGRFFHLKKKFGKIMKKAKEDQKNQMLIKIQQLEEKNPTAFWKLYNDIKSKQEKNECIEPDILLDHFKNLHGEVKNAEFDMKFEKEILDKRKS